MACPGLLRALLLPLVLLAPVAVPTAVPTAAAPSAGACPGSGSTSRAPEAVFEAEDASEEALALLQLATQISSSPGQAAAAAQHPSSMPYRQPMHNVGDVQYSANITVGNQVMRGVLDTGSFEVLVLSQECRSCGPIGLYYNSSRSATHKPGSLMYNHYFGSGGTTSREGFEDFELGPLKAQQVNFWEVIAADMPILEDASFQAIVGVGPPDTPQLEAQANAEQATKVATMAKKMGKQVPGLQEKVDDVLRTAKHVTDHHEGLVEALNCTLFSVCLERAWGEPGWFIWNDDAPDLARARAGGDVFTELAVAGERTWSLRMEAVELQGGSANQTTGGGAAAGAFPLGCEEGCGAIIDSGTSLIAAPAAVVQRVQRLIASRGYDCSDVSMLPDISFRLGGVEYVLPPESYLGEIYGQVPEELRDFFGVKSPDGVFHECQVLLMSIDMDSELGPTWIVGMPFFREYYTAFDLERPRRILTAPATDTCHPAPPAGPLSLGQAPARAGRGGRARAGARVGRVDAAKLRLPAWARKAAGKGRFAM